MLWDEEAIKRRWSKSSRNKKKKKKLSLHDQQLPPRPRTRRAVPNQSECQVLTTPKKEQTPSPVLDACSLTETKKNKKNNNTSNQTNNQQQQTAPFARSRTERKRSLPAPCSLPTKAETKQEARAPHREPGTTDAPP